MNLITFNIDDKLIRRSDIKKLNVKKNLLFSYSCQHNKEFVNNSKNKIAQVFNYKDSKAIIKYKKNITKIYNETLSYLKICLNKAHNKKYSKDYWEILIGKWLVTLVYQTYANWEIFKKIEREYNIKTRYRIAVKDEIFIPENTWHAHKLTRSSEHKYNLFHHWLLSKIIEGKNLRSIKIKLKKGISLKKKIAQLSKPSEYSNIIHKSLNNKIFYYLWDVPREVKLKAMKYFKFINISLNFKKLNINEAKKFNRKKIFFQHKKNNGTYQSFLKEIIKFTFPKIYLENYNSLKTNYNKLNWPNSPKYILTSYPYYDELFKFYCAQKYNSGSKIVLTQHGSDNIYKYDNWHVNYMYTNQLVWGKCNKKGLNKFIFTKSYNSKKEKFIFSNKKRILLILYSFTEMENRPPNGYLSNMAINRGIFDLTSSYLNCLSKNLQKKNDVKNLKLSRYPIMENSLKKKFKNLKFIKKNKSFNRVIDQYNLSIHFFISTPFFESIYLNKPIIVILNEKHNFRFNKKFLYYLKKFQRLGICFSSPIKAAHFINKNYNNLESWWNSSELQKVLNDFKEDFCRFSNDLNVEFEKILKI